MGSFEAGENEVLRLLGEQITGYDSKVNQMHAMMSNQRLDKKAQVAAVVISFICIIIAALAISAAYSQEHCITYIFGYCSITMFVIFGAICSSYVILSARIEMAF